MTELLRLTLQQTPAPKEDSPPSQHPTPPQSLTSRSESNRLLQQIHWNLRQRFGPKLAEELAEEVQRRVRLALREEIAKRPSSPTTLSPEASSKPPLPKINVSEDFPFILRVLPAQQQLHFDKGTKLLSFKISADGSLAFALTQRGMIQAYDTQTGERLLEHPRPLALPPKEGDMGSLDLSSDEVLLAVTGVEKDIYLMEPETGKTIRTLEGHKGRVTSVAFSPDRKFLVSTGEDHKIILWDLTFKKSQELSLGLTAVDFLEEKLQEVLFSPSGDRVLIRGRNKIYLYEISTQRVLKTLVEESNFEFYSAAFSIDGQRIVTTSSLQFPSLWDASTGEKLFVFVGDKKSVLTDALFTPDGKYILSISDRGRIRFCLDDEIARLAHLVDLFSLPGLPAQGYNKILISKNNQRVFALSLHPRQKEQPVVSAEIMLPELDPSEF